MSALQKIAITCQISWLPAFSNLLTILFMRSNPPLCLQLSSSSICEVQNQLMEKVQKLNFVKENSSATFIERKLSWDRKKPVPSPVSTTHPNHVWSIIFWSLLKQIHFYATWWFGLGLFIGAVNRVVGTKLFCWPVTSEDFSFSFHVIILKIHLKLSLIILRSLSTR